MNSPCAKWTTSYAHQVTQKQYNISLQIEGRQDQTSRHVLGVQLDKMHGDDQCGMLDNVTSQKLADVEETLAKRGPELEVRSELKC